MNFLNDTNSDEIVRQFWADFCALRAGQATAVGGTFDAPLEPPAHWFELGRFAADTLTLPSGAATQLVRRFSADVLDLPYALGVTAALILNMPNPRTVKSFRTTPMGKLLETAIVRIIRQKGQLVRHGDAAETLGVALARLSVLFDGGGVASYIDYDEPNPRFQRVTARPHLDTYAKANPKKQ